MSTIEQIKYTVPRFAVSEEVLKDAYPPDYYWEDKPGRTNGIKRFFGRLFKKHWGQYLEEVPGSFEKALEKENEFMAYINSEINRSFAVAEEDAGVI